MLSIIMFFCYCVLSFLTSRIFSGEQYKHALVLYKLMLFCSFIPPLSLTSPPSLSQVYFVYKEKMPRTYVWTIFVVATFVFVESICTIIVVTTT